MPSQFAITAATNTLRLDDKRQSEAQFTIFNASGRLLRGRVLIVPENPVSKDWLTLAGPVEQDFVIAGTHQYVVRVSVPPTAPAGSYTFRLDVLDVNLPDENLTQGPTVTFEVPEPKIEKKGFPIWIPIAIIVTILAIGGAIAAFIASQNSGTPTTATPTAVPTRAPTTIPTRAPTNTTSPPATSVPTPIPPFEVTRIQVSHVPAPGRICGRITVTFRAVVTFTGSGTANYTWSGDVSDSGSLSLNCAAASCAQQVPEVTAIVNMPANGERSVNADLQVVASNRVDASDEAFYICGVVP